MFEYNKADFCEPEQGIKYLFAKISIIYGSKFNSHWEGIDQQSILQTWAELLGVYATYRPSMDFAIRNMDKNFIPSALAVFELCKQAGRIPDKPHSMITKQATAAELIQAQIAKNEALRKIREFAQSITH
jgi:hypothetical protein